MPAILLNLNIVLFKADPHPSPGSETVSEQNA